MLPPRLATLEKVTKSPATAPWLVCVTVSVLENGADVTALNVIAPALVGEPVRIGVMSLYVPPSSR